MAEFCTNCAMDLGFCDADIDVEKISSELKNGYQIGPYLCEHCGLSYIGKTDSGEILILVEDDDGNGKWIPFVRNDIGFRNCDDDLFNF